MATGGGSLKTPIFSAIDTEIKEILGTRIDGLSNKFGGDSDNPLSFRNISFNGIYHHFFYKNPNDIFQF